MRFSSFLYRQKQRFRYYTAKNTIERKIAELNRFEKVIDFAGNEFTLKNVQGKFCIKKHGFVLEKNQLFNSLAKNSEGCFIIENSSIYFCINSLKLRVETADELFILNEIYYNKCYNFTVPFEEVIVIDIGMNVGFASLYFSTKPEVSKIYSFEPFKPTFENAKINFENNPQYQKKIEAYNFGWGKADQDLEVLYSESTKGKNRACNRSDFGDKKLPIKLFDGYKQLQNIVSVHQKRLIIKMDCEGAEHEIFESFYGHDFPKEVIGIIMEWHFQMPTKILQYLLNNNFKLVNTYLGAKTGLIYAFR